MLKSLYEQQINANQRLEQFSEILKDLHHKPVSAGSPPTGLPPVTAPLSSQGSASANPAQTSPVLYVSKKSHHPLLSPIQER